MVKDEHSCYKHCLDQLEALAVVFSLLDQAFATRFGPGFHFLYHFLQPIEQVGGLAVIQVVETKGVAHVLLPKDGGRPACRVVRANDVEKCVNESENIRLSLVVLLLGEVETAEHCLLQVDDVALPHREVQQQLSHQSYLLRLSKVSKLTTLQLGQQLSLVLTSRESVLP